jgi:hypothetical protein
MLGLRSRGCSTGPTRARWTVLHIVEAPSEEAVRERLVQDNWHQNGMLRITSVEAWTVLLDGLRSAPR